MNPFYIKEPLDKRISYYLFAAFLMSLPFSIFYSELILLGLLLHTAIQIRKEKLRTFISRQLFILQGIFFLTIICTVYAADSRKAFRFWENHSAILFIPLIFATTSLDMAKYRTNFFVTLSWIITLVIIYLYGHALYTIHYFDLPLIHLFYPSFVSHNFSEPLQIHPTYLSMYAGICVVFVVQQMLRGISVFKRSFLGLQAVILLTGMIQLGSKSVMLAMILILVTLVFTSSLSMKKKLMLLLPACIIIIIAGSIVISNDSFRKKYVTDLFEDLQGQTNALSETDSRLLRWKACIAVIKKAPILGYGTGMEKQVLKEEYYKRKLYNSYLQQLDAHNQYLGFWITYGIAGLLLFLYTLYWGVSKAFRSKDQLFLAFMILLIIVSLTENTLAVNKGIMFYAFFFSLFGAGTTKMSDVLKTSDISTNKAT